MQMLSVLVADAQQLLADALRVSLALEPDIEVMDERPVTGLEAVEAIVRRRPDVCLLDYWMAGMEGPAATRMALKKAPRQKIVLLGWFHGPPEIKAARRAGAVAFLSKELTVEQVAGAVRRVGTMRLTGTKQARPGSGQPKVEDAWQRLIGLTPREIEILGRLAICGRPEEAAKGLGISVKTIRIHIQHILAKTGARSQVEAVAVARQHGLI